MTFFSLLHFIWFLPIFQWRRLFFCAKKGPKFWTIVWTLFQIFFLVWDFFAIQIFYKQKTSFFGWCIPGRAPSGRAGPGPPSSWQGGNIEKVHRKKCPGKLHFIFGEKYIFWQFYPSKRSDLCLVRQISSRGSGSNFFYPKLIGDRQSYDIFFNPSFYMVFAYISVFWLYPP